MKAYLWVPLVAVLLVPVPIVILSHKATTGSGVNGELLIGLSSLDSILARAQGKPVLLNFWATWCGPCVRELPELETVYRSYGEEAVFLAVDIGDPDLRTLESFRENNPTGLTVIWLNSYEADSVSERYSLPDVLPVSIVLNGNKEETARAVGARSIQWFSAAVEGASTGETGRDTTDEYLHVYVVGPEGDPLVADLLAAAEEIAGVHGYEFLDPTDTADSTIMEQLYLPMAGWPYAQLCVNGACRPPVHSSDQLLEALGEMR